MPTVRTDPGRDLALRQGVQPIAVDLFAVEARSQRLEPPVERLDPRRAREALAEALEFAAITAQARSRDDRDLRSADSSVVELEREILDAPAAGRA